MEKEMSLIGVSIYMSEEVMICPIQSDLYDDVIYSFRHHLLKKIKKCSEIVGIVIDVSEIKIMDLGNMKAIDETLKMARLLGVDGCLVGLQPALALALVDMGFESKTMHVEQNMENGIAYMHKLNRLKNKKYAENINKIDEGEEENDEGEEELNEIETSELIMREVNDG